MGFERDWARVGLELLVRFVERVIEVEVSLQREIEAD